MQPDVSKMIDRSSSSVYENLLLCASNTFVTDLYYTCNGGKLCPTAKLASQLTTTVMLIAGVRGPWENISATIIHGIEPVGSIAIFKCSAKISSY